MRSSGEVYSPSNPPFFDVGREDCRRYIISLLNIRIMSLSEAIWPLFFPLLGAVIALVQIRREKKAATFHRKLEILLMWQLVIGIGLSFLSAATGHLFFSDQVAQSIGWPPGKPVPEGSGHVGWGHRDPGNSLPEIPR